MNNIKALREKAGKTQVDLAAELGVTQGAVAHYESGRRDPTVASSRKITAVINRWGVPCSLDDVFPPESGCEPS